MALKFLMLKTAEKPKASNKGMYINDWNSSFKMKAIPWCASSMSAWSAEGHVIKPIVKSAAARSFRKGTVHSLSEINRNLYVPKPGDYRVKSRRGGNHVDLIIAWNAKNNSGLLLGGNVSDKVSLRKVTLKSMVGDGTTGITEVVGNYDYEISDSTLKAYVSFYENVSF